MSPSAKIYHQTRWRFGFGIPRCACGAHGSWLGKRAEARRGDFQAAFGQAVEFALAAENAIDAVVISGDLFDSHRPHPDLIAHVKAACERLQQAGKPGLDPAGSA